MKFKKYEPEEIDQTLTKLKNAQLIDDARFARLWLRSQISVRPSGRRLLELKMFKLGLSRAITEAAFAELDENSDELTNAQKALDAKMRSFAKYDGQEKKQKMLSFLMRRGFNYGVAKEAVENIDSVE